MKNHGVCVITHPLSGAGENATRTLLDILAAIGPVTLVTADLPADSTIWDDHDVELLTKEGAGESILVSAARFLLNQLRMCRVLARRDEDFVLFFGATAYLLPIVFARIIGKTVLVEPRGDVPLTLKLSWERRIPMSVAWTLSRLVWVLERAGFLAAHRVVTYTPNMARQLGLNPDDPKVYPHGARYVDTDRFDIDVPFENRDEVVGFIGRLDEEKGVRELAAAAKRLPDAITFRFVGDGPLYNWLRTELADEIEAGRVELTGWVDHDDVPSHLNEMKLLVMPSHPTEGLPTTILEAMACGVVVCASSVSGIPDVVGGDTNPGFLFPSGAVSEVIAELVQEALQADLGSKSEHSRKRIVDEFTFDCATQRYQRIFDEAG